MNTKYKRFYRRPILCMLAAVVTFLVFGPLATAQETAKQLYDKAVECGKAGDFAQAKTLLTKASTQQQGMMPILVALDFAESAAEGKMPGEAAKLVFESTSAGNKKDTDTALKLAVQARDKAPSSKQVWLHLGVAHVLVIQMGGNIDHADDAIKAYQKALEIDPKYGLAHHNLGVAFAATHKWVDAQKHLERAVELGIKVPSDLLQRVKSEAGSGK